MSFLTFSTAQSNIRICVRGDNGDKMSLTGSCLRVKKGYSCHYLFLVKCLLQTRYHMGWWVPPHPARAKREPAQMTLDGDAPGGGSSQRRLWCISGWLWFSAVLCDASETFQMFVRCQPSGDKLTLVSLFVPLGSSRFNPSGIFPENSDQHWLEGKGKR